MCQGMRIECGSARIVSGNGDIVWVRIGSGDRVWIRIVSGNGDRV